MQNEKEIIAAIATYLEENNLELFQKIYANRVHSKFVQGQIDYYKLPPNQWPDDCVAIKSRNEDIDFHNKQSNELIKSIAAEISAAIAPLVAEKDLPLSELFTHMSEQHDLTLTDTELGDIIHVARGK